jgi:hypothetical protein
MALVRLCGDGSVEKIRVAERVGSRERENVQVEDPLALELTPTCQAIFWPAGLAGVSSDVWERGGLGTSGEGTKGVVP